MEQQPNEILIVPDDIRSQALKMVAPFVTGQQLWPIEGDDIWKTLISSDKSLYDLNIYTYGGLHYASIYEVKDDTTYADKWLRLYEDPRIHDGDLDGKATRGGLYPEHPGWELTHTEPTNTVSASGRKQSVLHRFLRWCLERIP